jgi:hypothetical protein
LWGQDFAPYFIRNLTEQEDPRSMATKADDIALRNNGRKEHHVQMSRVFCFVLVINKIT